VITRLGSGGPREDAYGYSRVVEAGPLVMVDRLVHPDMLVEVEVEAYQP
jgi:hypothetical protein